MEPRRRRATTSSWPGSCATTPTAGLLDLRVHDYFTDDELWRYLSSLDVSVLPYRFGTHWGWLEACRDLGTAVIAPTCGYFADQAPVLSYQHDEAGLRPGVVGPGAEGGVRRSRGRCDERR